MATLYAAFEDALLVADGDGDPVSRFAGHEVECVAAHPERPERVFCGTFSEGLHRSTDGGETWECVGRGTIDPGEDPETAQRRGAGAEGVSVMSVALDPSDPDTVWVGTEPSALFRSTDGGDTWEPRGDLRSLSTASEWYFPPRPYTHHVRWVEVDPADSAHLYVGIEAGALLVTRDAGETWTERPEGARRDNHSLTTHPDAPERAWTAAGDGYAETTDGGAHWDHPQTGLDHRYCWSVVVDPADPDAVLLSSASGPRAAHSPPGEAYVYRRRDGAWEHAEDGLPAGEGLLRPVLAVGFDAGEAYASTNRGLFVTRDFGGAWERFAAVDDRFAEQTPTGLAVVP